MSGVIDSTARRGAHIKERMKQERKKKMKRTVCSGPNPKGRYRCDMCTMLITCIRVVVSGINEEMNIFL